jgi:ADP-ribosyl-[dinitrogen reductase] hydrolase
MTSLDRIHGAVYGALVGDALGVPVEFSTREERAQDPVDTMRAGGTWGQRAGTWSDDGALLLCTLEGLADNATDACIGQLYVDWLRQGRWAAHGSWFDIGQTTQLALSRLADGEPPGTTNEAENGNGSLMRILPVGLDPRADGGSRCRRAMDLSTLTHGHVRSQLACAFYCLVASCLLAGATPMEAYAQACSQSSAFFATHPGEQKHFARILDGRLATLSKSELQSSGYVIHTLEASLWCVLNERTFCDAVLTAVNLGGDTDTTGCVTGGLAGTLHGIAAIPSEWLATLPRRQELDALLARFHHSITQPS